MMTFKLPAGGRRVALSLLGAMIISLAQFALPEAGARPTKVQHEELRIPRSGEVDDPSGFRMVGVSWENQSDAGPVSFRALGAQGWTPWIDLEPEPEEGPDLGSPEMGTAATPPFWVGEAIKVQVQGSTTGAKVHLLDPGRESPVSAISRAAADPAKPQVFSRAEWGADESIRRCCIRYASRIKVAFVHHTVTANNYQPWDSAAMIRAIYSYHVHANGWDDIGYNVLIDRFGQIFEGRAGGLDRAVVGAHAQGFNTGSSGIAYLGTASSVGPPFEATDAFKTWLAWRLDVDRVDPMGSSTMTSGGSNKYPEGTAVNLPNVSAHRDVGLTECPGGTLYAWLPEFRQGAASIGNPKMYSPALNRDVFTPNGDGVADSIEIGARLSENANWRVDVKSPLGEVVRSWTGAGGSVSVPWDGRNTLGAFLQHDRYQVSISASNPTGSVRPWSTSVQLAAWPEGTLLSPMPGGPVFYLDDARLRHIEGAATLESRFRWSEIVHSSWDVISAYPSGAPLPFREGTLFYAPWEGKSYLVSGGLRHWITSPEVFFGLGLRPESVLVANIQEPLNTPLGANVDSPDKHLDGIVMQRQSPGMYVSQLELGLTRPIFTVAIFESRYRWNEIAILNDQRFGAYPPGLLMNFRDGSLFWVASEGKVYVVSDGIKRWISSPQRLQAYGYQQVNIYAVGDAEASLHPTGPPL